MSKYTKDPETGVYIRYEKKSIGYADGGEQKMLKILSSVEDRSTFSEELIGHMTDWPTEYHLSRKRHLILRSLNIQPGDRVLELGCGCGAITRYLIEIGAKVTAVEGELSRAAVAAKRCEGYDTVEFIVEDFLNLELDIKYDWVLMIGVFEYSQKYGKGKNRQFEYLDIARKHLLPDGSLVIAIENKLGIKYINGAGEDHNGKINYGPQDLYDGNDITTWGREELREILIKNGFAYQNFNGVFPDYKLPKVIFNEEIDDFREFRAEELLHYSRSLDYRGKNQRFFDESLVAGALRKNGLLIDFANSFLIIAKTKNPPKIIEKKLAVYYSIDRKRDFCTETQFIVNGNVTEVSKRKIFEKIDISNNEINLTMTDGSVLNVVHQVENRLFQYHEGQLFGLAITKSIKRGQIQKAAEFISLWLNFLLKNFAVYDRKTGKQIDIFEVKKFKLCDLLIQGDSLDCGPQNIILNDDLVSFDLEWRSVQPIPLSWQIMRNCQHILRVGYGNTLPFNITELVGLSANFLQVEATTDDVKEGFFMEKQFQEAVGHPEPSNHIKLAPLLNSD